jgi:hypothetical protein
LASFSRRSITAIAVFSAFSEVSTKLGELRILFQEPGVVLGRGSVLLQRKIVAALPHVDVAQALMNRIPARRSWWQLLQQRNRLWVPLQLGKGVRRSMVRRLHNRTVSLLAPRY